MQFARDWPTWFGVPGVDLLTFLKSPGLMLRNGNNAGARLTTPGTNSSLVS